jgi:hypothetical protein
VEEAVLNSLLKATTVAGRDGHVVEALPLEPLQEMIAERRKIGDTIPISSRWGVWGHHTYLTALSGR